MAEISIIIPSLNEETGIVDFLSSLQSLRPRCQLILVDGGSTDNTMKLASAYVDKLIISSAGRAIQMNKGATVANAPILLFLHADTLLPLDAIEQNHYATKLGYQWGWFNIKLTGHYLLSIVAWLVNKRSRLTGIATGDQALFIDKTIFTKLGGFADISLMEDIELTSRLNKLGQAYCIPSKVISSGRRWLKFGIIKTILLMWSLRLRYFLGTSPSELEQLYRKGQFWKD